MILEVTGASYDTAAEAWAAANLRAADLVDDLADGLDACDGMGGDDASSHDFVEHYDAGARETLTALSELTEAVAAIATLTDASSHRHRAADAAADLHRPETPRSVEWVGYGYGERRVRWPTHTTPPSALGADNTATPPLWDLVVDQLQGLAWPSADIDRLHDAARLWRRTGDRTRDLDASLRVGENALADQRSPEIPLALAASTELRGHAETLATQCHHLAQACDDYADQVETTRHAVTDLLEDLAVELAATAVVTGILSVLTLGGAALAGTAAGAVRVATCARRIITVLTTLRTARAMTLAAHTYPQARTVRTALQKFRNIEHVSGLRTQVHGAPWLVPRRMRRFPDGSARNLRRHWDDHRDDFPDLDDVDDYDRAIRHFLADPPAGTRTIVRADGSVVQWHPGSNTFAIMDGSGAPNTMYKLDTALNKSVSNKSYFLSQLDR